MIPLETEHQYPITEYPILDAELETHGGAMGCLEGCRVGNEGTYGALLAARSKGS